MIYGLYLSATGVITAGHQQDVIANNLANAETNGFKRQLALTETRRMESQTRAAMGVRDPLNGEIGGGQLLAPSYFDQSQGQMIPSSNNFDAAVQGKGFLTVQGDDGKLNLTRNGALLIDPNSTVRTSAGQIVLDDKKKPLTLDMTGRRQADLTIGTDGTIRDSREGNAVIGKIGLLEPQNESEIKPIGGNLYAPVEGAKLTAATGRLIGGMTEGSNVDPTTELTKLMETQRLLEANANMIRTQDQTLGRAVNDIGKIG